MIENIKSPKDLNGLDYDALDTLACEIREKIISTVEKNGGHLASNLGMVEATIALHRVFDTPLDKIIFDVSHQCYAHKIICERLDTFDTLRQKGGISGFTNPDESIYDTVFAGHSGTSLSTAIGIAEAEKLKGSGLYTVAVIGDGSFTNGMAYEALNNCGNKNLDLIILLNDNEMSISKNVGGMHHSLSTIRTSTRYFALKHGIKRVCTKIPFIGESLVNIFKYIRDFIKRISTNYNIFESLGCDYIGPVDGNNIKKLEAALIEAKTKHRPSVVHIVTKKGKGYTYSEENPESYHALAPFDREKGVDITESETFSGRFGKYLCALAEKDERICAITAAMVDGTGLSTFSRRFPDRFFDTAIAEEHGATFSAGLTYGKMKPVFAIYSTFAQRIYDQLFHDAALQKLPLVIALDRAGIVGADGVTHQGLYDYSLFSSIPGIRIYSPETYHEMERCFDKAFAGETPAIVRYPRGSESLYDRSGFTDFTELTAMGADSDIVIITYGKITEEAYGAAQILEKLGIGVRIVKLIDICPLPFGKILALIGKARLVYILEEGIRSGSVGEKIAAKIAESSLSARVIIKAVDNAFVPHGQRNELLCDLCLDKTSVAHEIYNVIR